MTFLKVKRTWVGKVYFALYAKYLIKDNRYCIE